MFLQTTYHWARQMNNSHDNCRKLILKLPLIKSFRNAYVDLIETWIQVEIGLHEEETRYVSGPVRIGSFNGSSVYASVKFTHRYDSSEDQLILRSEDINDDGRLQIETFTSLTDISGSRLLSTLPMSASSDGDIWMEYVEQEKAISALISQTCKQCINQISQQAKLHGVSSVLILDPPPVVSSANVRDYHSMYFPEQVFDTTAEFE